MNIVTRRVQLRYFSLKDVKDVYEYSSLEEVSKIAGWSCHNSLEETRKVVKKFIKQNEIAIVDRKTNHVVGSIGIMKPTFPNAEEGIEIAYALHPSYWKKGIMKEALNAALKELFMTVNTIYVCHFVTNDASKNVIDGLGFQYIGDRIYEAPEAQKEELASYYILKKDEFIYFDETLNMPSYQYMRKQVGFRGVSDEQAEKLLENSLLKVCMYHQKKPVGFARCISDSAYLYLIADVMIDPEYKSFLLGKRIVRYLLHQIEDIVGNQASCVMVMSLKGKEDFYESLGFSMEEVTGLAIITKEDKKYEYDRKEVRE